MSNPSKRRGTRWENDVVELLRQAGFPHAERRALAGKNDRGDIAGIPGVVIECKAARRYDLAGWCAELRSEVAIDGADLGVIFVKAPGFPPRDGYAVMPISRFIELLRDLEGL